MRRIKNIDRNGKPVKSGMRATFDGTRLMGEPWLEHGILDFNRYYNCWFFVPDEGEHHAVVFDVEGLDLRTRRFKYYEVQP